MPMKKLIDIIKDERVQQFIRFCIVGSLSSLMCYGIYLLLIWIVPTDWTLWASVSYSVGYVVSWFFNLWLTSVFTFKEKVNVKRGIGFAASHGVTYLLHIGLLNLFIWLGVPEAWAPIPMYCIAVPTNFVLVRTVFKKMN